MINSYANTGTGGLNVTGGTLTGANATNGSTFQCSGSTLNGTFDTATLSKLTLLNSNVLTLTKGNNSLDNVSLDGGLTLNGGSVTITGGLTHASGATFNLNIDGGLGFSTNYTFADATVDFGTGRANLEVDSSHTLTLDHNLHVTGTSADFRGGSIINNTLLSSGNGGIWYVSPTTLVNNATLESRNAGSVSSVSGGSFANNGIFQAINGGSSNVSVTTLANSGTFQALSNGHLSLSAYRTYPLGTIKADGAGSTVYFGGFGSPGAYTVNLNQGENLSATNGGKLELGTTLDNTNKTFDPDAYGSKSGFVLDEGTIQGGSIANSDDLRFLGAANTPNLLQNVTLSGGLNLAPSQGAAQIQGTFHYGPNAIFNLDQDSNLKFVGDFTLDNATVQTNGGSLGISNGTLTLGSNLTVASSSGVIGPYVFAGGTLVNNTQIASASSGGQWVIQTYNVINNGTFQATNGGSFLVSSASTLTNAGSIKVDALSSMTLPTYIQTNGLTQVNGSLNITSADPSIARVLTLQGGILSGTGSVAGEVVNTGGAVHPGLGVLGIGGSGYGDYTQGVNGIFQEDLSGKQYGILAVGGTANLNGSLHVSFPNGFAPALGTQFTFLTYGAKTGTFASIFSTTPGYDFSVSYLPTEAVLTVTKVPAAVPSAPHILWENTNGTASVWTVAPDFTFTFHNYGPYPGWTATALADTPDGKTHLLWNHTSDGQISVWDVDALNTIAFQNYGPFPGWAAAGMSAGPDGRLHLLWNHRPDGQMSLWSLDNGAGTYAHTEYGPFPGWTAKAVATGGDGATDVVWTSSSGQGSSWKVSAADGSYIHHEYGPYPGWTANALAAGPDGRASLVWGNTNGTQSLWNADFGTGSFTFKNYGPYPGWAVTSAAVGADGVRRLLWSHASDGQASLWTVDSAGGFAATNYGPYPGWSAVSLSAGQ